MSARHTWGEPQRFALEPSAGCIAARKSERACVKCGLVKTTRHETAANGRELHATEFWRGLDRVIPERGTPPCAAPADERTVA